MSGIELLFSDHHGVYIPKLFVEDCGEIWGLSEDDKLELSEGPDNEYY
jgi:hypothetical protein